MRSRFDEQLARLNKELIEMGARCEEAIALAAKALTTGDVSYAEKAEEMDREIDQSEHDIETLCLKLLLHQQPVARDLRQISSALKMITDMERIGDQASDIAEIVKVLGKVSIADCGHIDDMATATIKMVSDSVDAYVRRDVDMAKKVEEYDDIVDEYFTSVKQALIKRILEHPEEAELTLDLLMIAKYFERIGDHATNIAEWVEFSVTGIHNGGQEL